MLDTWGWVLAILGALLTGLAKTGIAGLGVLTVAIYASIMPAKDSVGVLLIVLIAADVVAVAAYRREADWSHLVRLFPWAAVGIAVGALTLGRIDDQTVSTLIGGILVALVVLRLVRQRAPLQEAPTHPHRAFVVLTGLAAGFTTMVANAAGPIMILYLLAMRLPKMNFIGTSAWFFLAINVFKVPFAAGVGVVTLPTLALSLRLAPFAVVGALSGRWLIRYIPQRAFENLALVLTLIAGLRMLVG